MDRKLPLLCLAALFGLLGGSALAQPVAVGEEGALAEILAPEPGLHVCYARSYDAAHLAGHPQQTVTSVLFRLEYYRHDPDDYYPKGQRNYYFSMGVTRRGSDELLATAGECVPGVGTISCGVECDGGGVLLERKGPDAVLIDLEATGRIRMAACGDSEDEAGIDLLPGRDDKQFLLRKADAAACRPLEQRYAPE